MSLLFEPENPALVVYPFSPLPHPNSHNNTNQPTMSLNDSHDKEHGSTLPLHETSTASPSEHPTPNHHHHHHTIRTEIPAFLGEFIGTFMFLSMAFSGTQIALNAASSPALAGSTNPLPDVTKLLYIAFAFGISLAINVAIFADVSGGKFVRCSSFLPFFTKIPPLGSITRSIKEAY